MFCNFYFSNSVYNKANIFLSLIEYELNSLLGANCISVHIRFDLERYLLIITFIYLQWSVSLLFFVSDESDIILEENDIDDECVHVELKDIRTYSKEHLTKWLIYREDSLKGLSSLRDFQIK